METSTESEHGCESRFGYNIGGIWVGGDLILAYTICSKKGQRNLFSLSPERKKYPPKLLGTSISTLLRVGMGEKQWKPKEKSHK